MNPPNDEKLFEELSKINNELVNARRELSRLNADLDSQKKFLSRVLQLIPETIFIRSIEPSSIDFPGSDDSLASRASVELAHLSRTSEGVTQEKAEAEPDDTDYAEAYRNYVISLTRLADEEPSYFEFPSRDGTLWYSIKERPFTVDGDGNVVHTVGIVSDITRVKSRELVYKDESLKDPLTGLLNRRGFAREAEDLLSEASERREKLAVFFFDIDDFKEINDTHGHDEGDKVLVSMAKLLSDNFRGHDIVVRYGGDEFAAIARDADERASASLSARIDASLAKNMKAIAAKTGHESVGFRFSSGFTVFDPQAPENLDTLVTKADEAMYTDKKADDDKGSLR